MRSHRGAAILVDDGGATIEAADGRHAGAAASTLAARDASRADSRRVAGATATVLGAERS